jgi:hypothetical protein
LPNYLASSTPFGDSGRVGFSQRRTCRWLIETHPVRIVQHERLGLGFGPEHEGVLQYDRQVIAIGPFGD